MKLVIGFVGGIATTIATGVLAVGLVKKAVKLKEVQEAIDEVTGELVGVVRTEIGKDYKEFVKQSDIEMQELMQEMESETDIQKRSELITKIIQAATDNIKKGEDIVLGEIKKVEC